MKPKMKHTGDLAAVQHEAPEVVAICAKLAGIDLARADKSMAIADAYWFDVFGKTAALVSLTPNADVREAADLLCETEAPSAQKLEQKLTREVGLSRREAHDFVQAHAAYLMRLGKEVEQHEQISGVFGAEACVSTDRIRARSGLASLFGMRGQR